jgi:hypothetical protein
MIQFPLRGLREDERDRRLGLADARRTLLTKMARLSSCSPSFHPTIRRWRARSGSSERRGWRRVATMEQVGVESLKDLGIEGLYPYYGNPM